MSQIWIPASKAARERLRMMRDPAALAIPFDMDSIAPFGIRVFEGEHSKYDVRLTYRNQDIAMVGSYGNDGFGVNVVFAATPEIEVAVRRIFTVIDKHLSQVVRLHAEERRQAQDAEALMNTREARKAAAEARARQDADDAAAEALRRDLEDLDACCGFEGEDVVHGHVFDFRVDDVKTASMLSSRHDVLRVSTYGFFNDDEINSFDIQTQKDKCWEFKKNRQGAFIFQKKSGRSPDPEKVIAEVAKIAVRNNRLNNPDLIREKLQHVEGVPLVLEHIMLTDLLSPVMDGHIVAEINTVYTAENEQGVSFRVSGDEIALLVEGVEIVDWHIHRGFTDIQDVIYPGTYRILDYSEFSDPELLRAVGSLWVQEIIKITGHDPALFAPFDVEEIADSARTIDLGYEF